LDFALAQILSDCGTSHLVVQRKAMKSKANGHKISSLKDLRPDPRNARTHGERNVGMIERSLESYGAGRSILIDGEGQIIAGHGVIEAAANVGIEKVVPVEASGHEIIAVVRRGLTDQQKAELALADNRTSDLSEFDPAVLKALSDDGLADLDKFFFPEELTKLFADALGQGSGEGVTPEEARRTLAERFIVPPFSVLDARQGYWQDRKRAWIALGIKGELGRGGAPKMALETSATVQRLKPSADQATKRARTEQNRRRPSRAKAG
jgi:hypothetical protein